MKKLWSHLVAGLLILIFIITFTWLAIQRHWAFQSEFDLGVYNQVVWNTLHGRMFFYTSTGQPLLHLSNHADPILLLLAPFYLIYNGPEMLLFLQAALIGLAGLPVFWLAREKLNSNLAGICLLLAYLLFPAVQVVVLSDFHPPALAFALLMFAFYFLEKRKSGWFFLSIILAMACKEQIPLQVIFLGLYALLRHRDWRLGLTTIVLGATWFVVVMYWVIPAYSVTGDHIFLHYYADFGEKPADIFTTILTRPDLVIKNVWQPAKLTYLRDILAPLAFLSLFGWPVLLIGTPSFAINLLSSNPAMHNATQGHYVADVIPWLMYAALFGAVYLSRGVSWLWLKLIPRLRHDSQDVVGKTPHFENLIGVILAVVAIGWHLFYGFSPLAFDAPQWVVGEHERLGHDFISRIPPDAPISAQSKLYAHLSHRTIAYVFPDRNDVQYILLDVTSDTTPFHPYNYRDEVKKLLESDEFGLVDAADGYILLERGQPIAPLPDAFYSFARPTEVTPQYPVEVVFGDSLRLVGFDLLDNPRRQETRVRLYWQALRPIEETLQLYPFFTNDNGEIIEDTSLRPMTTQIWYPPTQWQPGETVTSQTLPWPLGERWSLGVGVLAGSDWSQWPERMKVTHSRDASGLRRFDNNTWVRLATFQREAAKLVEVLPETGESEPSQDTQFNFDNKMGLIGYEAIPKDDTLSVTLYWQALSPMFKDYTIFVHLFDDQGNQISQHDGQPWWEVPLPTSTWQSGEKLYDLHQVPLPNDLLAGTYTLRVGVYYWQNLERLPVLENRTPVGDSVELGSITIE